MQRSRILSLIALSATISTPALAAQPFPTSWLSLKQAGVGLGDVDTDGQNNGREVVGDADNPAVFVAFDSTAFFVRMRLDDTPLAGSGTELRPYGWGLLIDTDGDFSAYEFSLMADGITETLVFAENTTQGTTGDPSDVAETVLY